MINSEQEKVPLLFWQLYRTLRKLQALSFYLTGEYQLIFFKLSERFFMFLSIIFCKLICCMILILNRY